MALNIKNKETEELARRLAAATGESLTGAVTVAPRERLARVDEEGATEASQRAARIRALAAEAATRWTEPYRSTDHGDILYGDDGLPR